MHKHLTEKHIRKAIDQIFVKYDKDRSGTLDLTEVKTIVEEAFRQTGTKKTIAEEDVKKFVSLVDANSDGIISKDELFLVFKKAI